MKKAENHVQKILIADQEPFIRDTLKIKLKSKGLDVILAETGKDMVRIAGHEKPDLILTEINFKDLDMYRACQILKGNSRTKEVPIIVLTHEVITPERQFMFNPYVAKFMSKPFSPRAVEKTIKEVLTSPNKENA